MWSQRESTWRGSFVKIGVEGEEDTGWRWEITTVIGQGEEGGGGELDQQTCRCLCCGGGEGREG